MIWILQHQQQPLLRNQSQQSPVPIHAILLTLLLHLQHNFGGASAFHIHRHHPHSNSVEQTPHQSQQQLPFKVIYANGMTEESLPDCAPNAVCNKVDTYDKPWIEKQCKCPGNSHPCSTSLTPKDSRTLFDKTKQYKMCEPVTTLPTCKYFRDVTWTLITKGDNLTQQLVHCQCPKDSVAYMIKRQVFQSETDGSIGFKFSFACSPQTKVQCQRKEPCRLFTVKRRTNVTEVNTSTLCQCSRGLQCPTHHSDPGAVPGKFYHDNQLRTYSGYCH